MYQPLTIFVGLRYLRAKRRNHFISFISLVSMAGIALGIMTLIAVISVMNGFERELRERILGMISHASIHGNHEGFPDWRSLVIDVQAYPQVVGAAPFIERQTLLRGERIGGATIRGIDPDHEPQIGRILSMMRQGQLDDLVPGQWQIVLGVELANRLGVSPGDKVMIYAPEIRVTPAGVVPQVRQFEVSGMFESGMHEFDSALALIHLEDAQRLFRTGDGIGGIRLKFDDMMRAPWIVRKLGAELPGIFFVRDWTQEHTNLFRAVQAQRTMMFVILSLIIAVAAFNIISTLVMVVTDKQADIAIMKTMGLTPRGVMAVFMIQGSMIGAIGTLIGVLAGILLALNVESLVTQVEQLLNIEFIQAEVYNIGDLPSELRAGDVLRFASLSLALSVLSTLYPSWRAAQTEPVEALRYD